VVFQTTDGRFGFQPSCAYLSNQFTLLLLSPTLLPSVGALASPPDDLVISTKCWKNIQCTLKNK